MSNIAHFSSFFAHVLLLGIAPSFGVSRIARFLLLLFGGVSGLLHFCFSCFGIQGQQPGGKQGRSRRQPGRGKGGLLQNPRNRAPIPNLVSCNENDQTARLGYKLRPGDFFRRPPIPFQAGDADLPGGRRRRRRRPIQESQIMRQKQLHLPPPTLVLITRLFSFPSSSFLSSRLHPCHPS